MSTETIISKEEIAKDFVASCKDIDLSQEVIDSVADGIVNESNASYTVQGSVASFIFYQRFQAEVKGGKTFKGDAGGVSGPGGGGFWGTLYTDDIQRLYRDTISFQYNVQTAYLNINFFDRNSKFLGHIQAGGVSTLVVGVGGGSGSWK